MVKNEITKTARFKKILAFCIGKEIHDKESLIEIFKRRLKSDQFKATVKKLGGKKSKAAKNFILQTMEIDFKSSSSQELAKYFVYVLYKSTSLKNKFDDDGKRLEETYQSTTVSSIVKLGNKFKVAYITGKDEASDVLDVVEQNNVYEMLVNDYRTPKKGIFGLSIKKDSIITLRKDLKKKFPKPSKIIDKELGFTDVSETGELHSTGKTKVDAALDWFAFNGVVSAVDTTTNGAYVRITDDSVPMDPDYEGETSLMCFCAKEDTLLVNKYDEIIVFGSLRPRRGKKPSKDDEEDDDDDDDEENEPSFPPTLSLSGYVLVSKSGVTSKEGKSSTKELNDIMNEIKLGKNDDDEDDDEDDEDEDDDDEDEDEEEDDDEEDDEDEEYDDDDDEEEEDDEDEDDEDEDEEEEEEVELTEKDIKKIEKTIEKLGGKDKVVPEKKIIKKLDGKYEEKDVYRGLSVLLAEDRITIKKNKVRLAEKKKEKKSKKNKKKGKKEKKLVPEKIVATECEMYGEAFNPNNSECVKCLDKDPEGASKCASKTSKSGKNKKK